MELPDFICFELTGVEVILMPLLLKNTEALFSASISVHTWGKNSTWIGHSNPRGGGGGGGVGGKEDEEAEVGSIKTQ